MPARFPAPAKRHPAGNREPFHETAGDWREFLSVAGDDKVEEIRRHERTGRPLGSEGFLSGLEKALQRVLSRKKPGPKKNGDN